MPIKQKYTRRFRKSIISTMVLMVTGACKSYLERRGYSYSTATVHKYMNTELGLHSIVRPKKPEYEHGKPHKIFDNKLNQDFTADEINRKWCTDFTYLFLSNHEVRYNCTILDLHDRSVVASITDRRITSNLAIRTLQKALESQPPIKGGLILHSDQGSQFTSKAFVEFCESVNVTQSMSRQDIRMTMHRWSVTLTH